MDVGLYILYGNLYFDTSGPMTSFGADSGFGLDKWNHFCVTGYPWKFYLDGKVVDTETSPNYQEFVLDPGPDNLVFGQCYFREDKSFDADLSFVGKMAGINFWDYAMSDQDISELFKSCAAGKGNIISMADLKGMGEVKKISVSCKSE